MSAQPIPETCFAFAKHGAGSSRVSYLALHPMGFSVPRCLRFARCALTAPFHHHRQFAPAAVYFLWHFPSGVLSPSRVYPCLKQGYAASRPLVFGLSSPLCLEPANPLDLVDSRKSGAILRPSKTTCKLSGKWSFFKVNSLKLNVSRQVLPEQQNQKVIPNPEHKNGELADEF